MDEAIITADDGDRPAATVSRPAGAPPTFVAGHGVGGNAVGSWPSAPNVDAGSSVAARSGDWKPWAASRRDPLASPRDGVTPMLPRIAGDMPG
jgi:hypothetical protein